MCIVGTGVPDGPQAHDTVKRTAREGGPYEGYCGKVQFNTTKKTIQKDGLF